MASFKTPCIGICSTTSFGDLVCRGCKRYGFEVINWNGYDLSAKQAVLSRIEKLEIQILENKLEIVSPAKLIAGLKRLGIGFDETLSPWCWVHNLLTKAHNHVQNLSDFGLSAKEEWADYTVAQLCQHIDKELLELCKAHHERYYSAA